MAATVAQWLSDLSDGYVAFGDLHGKLPGPVVVGVTAADLSAEKQQPPPFWPPNHSTSDKNSKVQK